MGTAKKKTTSTTSQILSVNSNGNNISSNMIYARKHTYIHRLWCLKRYKTIHRRCLHTCPFPLTTNTHTHTQIGPNKQHQFLKCAPINMVKKNKATVKKNNKQTTSDTTQHKPYTPNVLSSIGNFLKPKAKDLL